MRRHQPRNALASCLTPPVAKLPRAARTAFGASSNAMRPRHGQLPVGGQESLGYPWAFTFVVSEHHRSRPFYATESTNRLIFPPALAQPLFIPWTSTVDSVTIPRPFTPGRQLAGDTSQQTLRVACPFKFVFFRNFHSRYRSRDGSWDLAGIQYPGSQQFSLRSHLSPPT